MPLEGLSRTLTVLQPPPHPHRCDRALVPRDRAWVAGRDEGQVHGAKTPPREPGPGVGGRDWTSRNPWLQAKDWSPGLPLPLLPPARAQRLGARAGGGRGPGHSRLRAGAGWCPLPGRRPRGVESGIPCLSDLGGAGAAGSESRGRGGLGGWANLGAQPADGAACRPLVTPSFTDYAPRCTGSGRRGAQPQFPLCGFDVFGLANTAAVPPALTMTP